MNEWLMIAGMALVTFLIRYGLIGLSGRIQLSPRIEKGLRFLPPAVLTAIVVPAVMFPNGDTLEFGLDNPRVIGALSCVIVGLWTKNLLLTIISGMAAFLLWQWIWSN